MKRDEELTTINDHMGWLQTLQVGPRQHTPKYRVCDGCFISRVEREFESEEHTLCKDCQ